MQFSPLKFQIPLAAGGISLMAFNYLQFAIPDVQGLVTLRQVLNAELGATQATLHWMLIGLMLLFTVINLISTPVLLGQLWRWRSNGAAYAAFLSGPPTMSVGIFVPIASLSMTACVILAPFAFFVPQFSSNLQQMMLPGLIFFGLLWVAMFRLEFKLLKYWLSHPFDLKQVNFVWLLDVFSFGLVSLTGTGIAAMANDMTIASLAAFASFFTLIFGGLLLIAKLSYLLYLQIKADTLPGKNILPAYFILIPISCLYGFSLYRIALYLKKQFAFDISILLFSTITIPYIIALVWGLFCLYLLFEYLKDDFLKSDFAPPQWAMV
jgi:hypothetical protein